ncbi:MAG: hypothetical protein K8S99_11455 [Planctomycetes bacterium]|nr:hypothetical protein [Planctomycetota bacterium]
MRLHPLVIPSAGVIVAPWSTPALPLAVAGDVGEGDVVEVGGVVTLWADVGDQRAMNAAALADLLSERAKRERASKGGKTGGVSRPRNSLATTLSSKLSKPADPKSRAAAAKSSGVSERKVRDAVETSDRRATDFPPGRRRLD